MSTLKEDALKYHAEPRPGKIATHITKPTATQRDLALAYSPGVAEPVREIHKDPEAAYRYTGKGNLVAVISDGSAVLGLGNVGALAGKPVMEGKGLLFKRFADIDVFDIEVATQDVEEFITVVRNIAGTFGGINLEDISAPRCFEIEKRLQAMLDIPVFHDDQHGTAVIIAAGLMNALELQGKTLAEVNIVCVGAGAAGIASMNLLAALGANKQKLLMVDSKGVLHTGRTDLNTFKRDYAVDTDKHTLADACQGADVFIGLSGPDIMSIEMLNSMAANPIVFALSNPDPEINPNVALALRSDLIMATGRSDHPNQINNVLGFPFLFRGALDVRARCINIDMLKAAVYTLAALAREPVPQDVLDAYGLASLTFGKDYIIPKPFDLRLRERVPTAVAQAAIDSGVARLPL
ncbi:MAG: malic enzyme-like NAD(P)-binding protein [Candidatus Thiothrix putei]|uniref:NADP-dependent malic enzyme n=1 Tax=Candidatus Thiothrix putei TaxID=3080811 RepID=A0AA95KMT0_9GAMM|nr:MAG: malic enzyme-like NAD(P)-binding protein [Candidatus Thiothrix putei]